MLFNSYEFILVFLPITLVVFFYIGNIGHHRVAITWLVAASLFYYGWWNPAYLSLILASMFVNYGFGVVLGRQSASEGIRTWNKKTLLILGIALNLGLLGYFKYANFFVDTVNYLAGSQFNLEKIILPLAISFFTFQQIAYLVDAYRGEAREYNFLHYCLFVCFFPQLIAGPIVHHKQMLPQFAREETYRFNIDNFTIGLAIFVIGLFKKVVFADSLALHANPVFDQVGGDISLIDGWVAALSYTFQLYFDFSGYSDMAIGVALMYGIRLPVNFNSPYKSTSIIEFWRRWHITLSTFLRDYLYIPLGGNRGGKVRKHVNLMITMLLGGLWHGAGWTFVIWGGLHGLYLIINHVFRAGVALARITFWSESVLVKWFSRLLTFLSVVVAWVFFRAPDFDRATNIISSMLGNGAVGSLDMSTHVPAIMLISLSFLIAWFMPNAQEYMASAKDGAKTTDNGYGPWYRKIFLFKYSKFHMVLISLMILIVFMMMQSVQKSEFLYYDF